LIELLAVIIILGILLLVAIPSVTSYINNSRKETYITTAKELIKGATNLVNSGDLDIYDTDITYYIPTSCINVETGGNSPYGKFDPAYILVTYDNSSFDYYWLSRDDQGIGIKIITPANDLKSSLIVSGIKREDINTDKGIGNRSKIVEFNEDCSNKLDPKPAEDNSGGTSGNEYKPICKRATSLHTEKCNNSALTCYTIMACLMIICYIIEAIRGRVKEIIFGRRGPSHIFMLYFFALIF